MPALPSADLDHVATHAAADLESLRGARLLITGAAGTVGSWLVETAAHASQARALRLTITALERRPGSFAQRHPHLAADPAIRVVSGDVRTVALRDAFTHVIHAASAASPRENAADPAGVIDMLELGTANIVACAAASGAARFLHVSSGSVYDRSRPAGAPLAESHPTLVQGTTRAQQFGAAKRRAERIVESAAIPAAIARLFTLLGPRIPLDGQFAIGNFLGDALAGRPVRVTGNGAAVRTYLHMADLAVWCWALLARGAAVRAYNVGASEPHTIAELAGAVARLAHPPVAVAIKSAPGESRVTDRYVPDVTRARTELSLATPIGLDDALARTWRWLVAA